MRQRQSTDLLHDMFCESGMLQDQHGNLYMLTEENEVYVPGHGVLTRDEFLKLDVKLKVVRR